MTNKFSFIWLGRQVNSVNSQGQKETTTAEGVRKERGILDSVLGVCASWGREGMGGNMGRDS